MTDEELRELAASLFLSLKETNDSIKAVNVRLAYTEDEARADRVRTKRFEETMTILTDLIQKHDARHDSAERRMGIIEERQDNTEARHAAMEEALTRLADTVDRYINARNTNGDKAK